MVGAQDGTERRTKENIGARRDSTMMGNSGEHRCACDDRGAEAFSPSWGDQHLIKNKFRQWQRKRVWNTWKCG
jgi:hypothetical protein